MCALALALLLSACSQTPVVRPDMTSTPPTSGTANDPAEVSAEVLATPDEVSTVQDTLATYQTRPLRPSLLSNAVSIDPGGTLSVAGESMFPMGFYHVSWAGTATRRLKDMNDIAAMGFNSMTVAMLDAVDDIGPMRKLVQAAHAKGMKLIIQDVNSQSVAALRNEPGILGWKVADDCQINYTPEQVAARAQVIKQLDPTRLTYASLGVSFSDPRSAYFGTTDATGNQIYPIGGGDGLSAVYRAMKITVREALQKGVMPIGNVQSFRWSGQRMPTNAEVYNMTSQALGAGVKGIMYYTYLDDSNDLSPQTSLRTELKKVAGEVKQLTPILLHGERRELLLSDTMHVVQWTYEGKRYLQVINVAYKSITAQFKLPERGKAALPVFANRPTGLKLQTDGLTVRGNMGALAVHWYQVQ